MENQFTKAQKLLKTLSLSLFLLLLTQGLLAQKQVSGVVTDDSGEELVSANVYEKGNPSQGAVTDLEGAFELTLSENAKVLVVSYVGYGTKEIRIRDKDYFEIQLSEQVELDEVVVTALGVEREEKALGYSVQKLGASQISDVKPDNVTNALAGKSAGVYVSGGSNGPTSSANINIRARLPF